MKLRTAILSGYIVVQDFAWARLTADVQQALVVATTPSQDQVCISPSLPDTWSYPVTDCPPAKDPSYSGTFSDLTCRLEKEVCTLECQEVPGLGTCACGSSREKQVAGTLCIEIDIGGPVKSNHCVSVADTVTCQSDNCQKCKIGFCLYINVATWECDYRDIWPWGPDVSILKMKTSSFLEDGIRRKCEQDLSCDGCCPNKGTVATGNDTLVVVNNLDVEDAPIEVTPEVYQDASDVDSLIVQFTGAYTEPMLCSMKTDQSENGFQHMFFEDMYGNEINTSNIDCTAILINERSSDWENVKSEQVIEAKLDNAP